MSFFYSPRRHEEKKQGNYLSPIAIKLSASSLGKINRWLSGAEAGKIASTPLSQRLNLMTLPLFFKDKD